jgi:hypothetical protein
MGSQVQCGNVSVFFYLRWWPVGLEGLEGKGKRRESGRESGRGGGKLSYLSWTRKEVVRLYLFTYITEIPGLQGFQYKNPPSYPIVKPRHPATSLSSLKSTIRQILFTVSEPSPCQFPPTMLYEPNR